MAIRDITNLEDVKKINDSMKSGGRNYISLDKKTFIRLLSKNIVSEYVHPLTIKGNFKPVVCLGGLDGGGFTPDECPICAEGRKHWDKRKELQNSKLKDSKKVKMEIELETKLGKKFQTRLQTTMIAVKGSVVIERVDGEKIPMPEWEEEAKLLNISKAQWIKLTKTIFENYFFMKTTENLIDRDLLFVKKEKEGKKAGQDYSEVEIEPMEKKSKAPKVTNELPDLDKVFETLEESRVNEILKEFLESDEDVEDEELEENRDDDDDEKENEDEETDDKEDEEDIDDVLKNWK